MRLLRSIRDLRRTHDPLIEVRISKDAILHNYRTFQDAYSIPVAPVLKSNAYGHGLIEVADILTSVKAPFLIVDSLYEVQVLRKNGIRAPLLIVGYTRPTAIARNRFRDVSFAVTSLEQLQMLAKEGCSARIHIKIDTGMRRQGVMPREIPDAIRALKASALDVEGVFSHFADADGADEVFTRAQILTWNELVKAWREAFPAMRYWHLAATAGSAFAKDIDANMGRLGTGLYGFPRHVSQSFPLRPALSMRSIVTGIKELKAGDKVGYNITFTAQKDMKIATVPVGYFEGVDRRLSNKGSMLIGTTVCPILGRVSMNISTIDVSNCSGVHLETSVTVFSDVSDDANSLVRSARLCDTTPLEILVHIPQHLRRTVY